MTKKSAMWLRSLLLLLLFSCNASNEPRSTSLPVTWQTGGPGGVQPSPSPTPTPSGLDAEEASFFSLINQYRVKNGLMALQLSPLLTASSKWMSSDMATNNYFSHTDSLGRDPFTRMADFGYSLLGYTGENIAAGNPTGEEVFLQWEESPPHNANMLELNYLVIGIGRAYGASSTYGWYWTTDFGSTVE